MPKPRQHGKSWVLPCWHGRSILFPHQHGKSRLYHVAAAAPFPSPCQHGKCTGLPCCHDPSQPSHAATLLTQSLGHLVGKAERAAFVKHWPKMVSKKLFGSILEGFGEGYGRIWEGLGRILANFWMDFNTRAGSEQEFSKPLRNLLGTAECAERLNNFGTKFSK